MNSDIKTAAELQDIIDALPNTHEPALYEAVIIDKSREPACTKYFHAARLSSQTKSPENM